ncbi:hypothetical protein L7F22_029355 [Adiantum nelumboides]|nr:hypothetical protein [Adiantum nelumboides]
MENSNEHMMQQMMQEFVAFFQQQQVMQQRMNLEYRMRKARQCVIEKLDRFDGRDISKFCRAYEEAMEDNGIDDSVAIQNFHLIVKPELRGPIEELQGQHSVSWCSFKVALKAEYFLEDSQRKFDQLSTGEQQSLRSEKVELFVQAADSHLQKSLVQLLEDPTGELGLTNDWDAVHAAINLLVKCQKRIDKSIVVDSHEDFEENGIVEKIVEKLKASSSPTLEGKEKPKATQSSTLDDSTMDDLIKELEDLEEPRERMENDVVLETKHAHFHEDEESDEVPRSHFLRSHWARATMETVVKIADFEEPILALVDHGLEINLMSMTLYQKEKWPIDLDHGWRIRAAKTQPGFFYGACANVKVTIGDVSDEQNFFVQDHSSYSLILDQPYIVALRMETKVLDDGSAYARVQSKDGKKAVQYMTVCVNHARNKEGLCDHPLPKSQKDFKENRFSQDFLSTIIKRGYDGAEEGEFSQVAFSSSFVGLTSEGSYSYRKFGELHKWGKQYVSHFQSEMQGFTVLDRNDVIFGIFEKVSHIDTIADLEAIHVSSSNNDFIKVNSFDMYEVLSRLCEKCENALEVQVETKYKTVTKKVRPQAVPLPKGSDNVMEKASQQPTLRDSKKIGHKFTKETLETIGTYRRK